MATAPKVLYHYTSLTHMKDIIESGYIKKVPSNLLRPKNMQNVNGVVIDPATDDFKPVVWLTSSLDPNGHGLIGRQNKKRIRFTIPMQRHFVKLSEWAKKNNMDPKWKKALTKGFNWQSWYISELQISLDEVSEIFDCETNLLVEWKEK